MSAPIDVKQNPDGSWTAKGGTSLTVVSVTAVTEHKAVAGHAVAMSAIQAQGKGWIKCSDSLPEVGTRVLAWSEQYGARESLYREHGKGSIAHAHGYPPYFSWEEPQSSWASSWKPTHWQPLPEPPTE